MKHILVLCTGNSCRSQIAHGYFSHFLNEKKVHVYSAGVETHGVNPRAIETMLEEGIDISQHTSNHIDEYRDVEFDLVFTVCDHAKERCPFFPTKAMKIHFNFPDPAKAQGSEEEIKKQFREVRDQIKRYVSDIINEHFLTEKK
jgi:arsenate reductase